MNKKQKKQKKKIEFNLQLSDLKLHDLWLRSRRTVLYGLYLVAYLLVQNVILSHIAIFGVKSMFMPALVVAVALFEGGWSGGLFGLAAGILSDLFFGSQTVLFTVLFPVIGFVCGFLGDFFFTKRLTSYAVMGAAALFIAAFAQMFSLLIYKGQSSFALWGTAILQTLWSLPFLFPSYYLCKNFPWPSSRDVPSPYNK